MRFAFLFSLLLSSSAFAEILRVEPSFVPGAHGMFVRNESEVWLSDTFRRLKNPSSIYDPKGKAWPGMPTGKSLAGISKHPFLKLYLFCDVESSSIRLLDETGRGLLGYSVPQPWNARWTASGKEILAVSFTGSVYLLTNEGESEEILRGLDAPFDVAPIGRDGFWLSEQGAKGPGQVCFFKRNPATKRFEKTACNKNIVLDNPEGLWGLRDGSVLAVDTSKGTLVQIARDGTTRVLQTNLGLPIAVQALGGSDWVVYTNRYGAGAALVWGRSLDL